MARPLRTAARAGRRGGAPRGPHTAIAGIVVLLLLVGGAVAVERFDRSAPRGAGTPLALPAEPAEPAPPPLETPVGTAPPAVAGGDPEVAPAPAPPPAAPLPVSAAPGGDPAAGSEPPAAPVTGPDPVAEAPAGTAAAEAPGAAPVPLPQPEPEPPDAPPAVSGRVSAGEGSNGAVVGLRVSDDPAPDSEAQPQVDLTLGTLQVIGDAPPAQGTHVQVGGTLVPDAVDSAGVPDGVDTAGTGPLGLPPLG